MALISASIDAFLVSSLAVVIPTYLFLRRRQASSQAPYRDWLTLLVVAHSVYVIYVLTLQWPPNLFHRLRIPLLMPVKDIRRVLLSRAGLPADAELPKPLETLLTRLSSFDARTVYVRFGQTVLQDCQHCKTLDHYALYALPGPLTEYVREGVVAGLLTIAGSHRGRWRTLAIVMLVVAFLAERYFISTAQITVPTDGYNVFMLHDNLWLLRQLFFLVLPVLIHCLPSAPPLDPAAMILNTRMSLEMTLRRTTYLKFLRAAIFRDPTLRFSATRWWEEQRETGESIREDKDVQATAEKLGSGYNEAIGEAKLLPRLREATIQLKNVALNPPASSSGAFSR